MIEEWRAAINVSRNTAIIFASVGRRFIQTRSVTLFGVTVQWFDTTRYLGVIPDTRLNCSPHIHQVKMKTAEWVGMLGPLLNRRSDLSIKNGVLLYEQLTLAHDELCVPRIEVRCPHSRPEAAGFES